MDPSVVTEAELEGVDVLDITSVEPEAAVHVSEKHARVDASQVRCYEHAVEMGDVFFVYLPLGDC